MYFVIFGHNSVALDNSACQLVHLFGSDWNISTAMWGVALKFCPDIYVSQGMNPTVFSDPLAFS